MLNAALQNSVLSVPADTLVVLDFETSGLSPARGDRAIEIGAVRLHKGQVVERFQRLMNPGFRINRFIEQYTGISNAMLREAAPCAEVMQEFADFLGGDNLVAHNASFDQRFLDAELQRVRRSYSGKFVCSMLLSRRLLPEAPSHKLGQLVLSQNLPNTGVFHRALADAEMTAQLWLLLLKQLHSLYQLPQPSFALVQQFSRVPKGQLAAFVSGLATGLSHSH